MNKLSVATMVTVILNNDNNKDTEQKEERVPYWKKNNKAPVDKKRKHQREK